MVWGHAFSLLITPTNKRNTRPPALTVALFRGAWCIAVPHAPNCCALVFSEPHFSVRVHDTSDGSTMCKALPPGAVSTEANPFIETGVLRTDIAAVPEGAVIVACMMW